MTLSDLSICIFISVILTLLYFFISKKIKTKTKKNIYSVITNMKTGDILSPKYNPSFPSRGKLVKIFTNSRWTSDDLKDPSVYDTLYNGLYEEVD